MSYTLKTTHLSDEPKVSANRVKYQRIIGFFNPCIIAVPYQGTLNLRYTQIIMVIFFLWTHFSLH